MILISRYSITFLMYAIIQVAVSYGVKGEKKNIGH